MESLRRSIAEVARQSVAVLFFAAVGFVMLVGGMFMLAWMAVESWDDPERRDADSRCPQRQGLHAEIEMDSAIDWCVYRGESGDRVEGRVEAGPVVRSSMWD